MKKLNTKSGQSMAFITIEDLYGSVECVAFPNVYEKIKGFLAVDVVVRASGKLDLGDGSKPPTVLIDKMQEVDTDKLKEGDNRAAASSAPDSAIHSKKQVQTGVLWLNATALDEGEFEELLDMLGDYQGGAQGSPEVRILRGKEKFRFGNVSRTRAFEAELRSFLPPDCIRFV